MFRPGPSNPFVPAFLGMLIVHIGLTACEREDNLSAAPKADVMTVPLTDTLPAVIAENTLLTNTRTWYITDWVYVTNEATLSIEPGTIVQMIDTKSTGTGLVIARGARINAAGLYNWPVLFTFYGTDTVHTCGSWSGIVLLGRAPQRKTFKSEEGISSIRNISGWAYGGEEPDDSSGILQHVRIVMKPCKCDAVEEQLQKGLLLLGVGRKTVVEDVVTDTSDNSPYRITAIPLR